ncbi:MAG: DeoR/GlpR family DNA-binding transcription regulator [Lachnospiraceae bacterium]
MLAIERRNEILAKLQDESKVLVSDLSQYYEVTEETIRRDLEKLEQDGFAKKTYGGAILCDNLNLELPYNIRKRTNIKGKQKIAKLIADMIMDGDRIMFDSSSTALYVAKEIKQRKNITVITNSIEILLELADKTEWKVLSTGGLLKEGALSLVGQQAEQMIDNFYMDKVIISCKGIDKEYGITDSNEPDVQIKKHMLRAAKQKILAVDSTKFDRISFMKLGELSVMDTFVTDLRPNEIWIDTIEREGIHIRFEE